MDIALHEKKYIVALSLDLIKLYSILTNIYLLPPTPYSQPTNLFKSQQH
jgi:hypothetical protein